MPKKKWHIKPLAQLADIIANKEEGVVSEVSVIYYVWFNQEQKEVRRFDIKRKL